MTREQALEHVAEMIVGDHLPLDHMREQARAALALQPSPQPAPVADGAHTPGPWGIERGQEYEIVSRSSSISATVAVVTARPSKTGEADARLIAAAPMMLSALQEVAAQFSPSNHCRVAEIVRAAIARATGREE